MTTKLRDRFVGTWRLVSFVSHDAAGRVASTYGPRPLGLLMYDKSGHMSVQIARSDRSQSTSAAAQASSEALTPAFDVYFGYFGGYTVDEDATTVTHHVKAGSAPGFDGTDQRRIFRLQGDCLVLTTLPGPTDGAEVTYVATWERLHGDRDV